MKKTILALLLFVLTLFPASVLADSANDITLGITYSDNLNRYVKAVEASGAIPYALPLIETKAEAKKELAKIDALIVSGGSGIDSSYFGEEPTDKLEEVSPERDHSDILMIKTAMSLDMPVLGICRGMQVMNVMQGGTLYQDIPDEFPGLRPDIQHRDPERKKWVTHSINIDENSLLHDITGSDTLNVQSWHHQGVKDLGKDLIVTARSDDGLIEAMEYTKQRFMMGVQFHPERAVVSHDGEQIEFFHKLQEVGLEYRKDILNQISAPEIATSTLYGHDNVKVFWAETENATGYSVYYKKAAASKYSLYKRTTDTYVKTGNLTDGVKYDFKIVPYIKRGSNFYEDDEYITTSIYTMKKLNTPSLEKVSDTQATISWNDIEGQTGYQISRSTSSTGTYILSTWRTTSGTSKVINYGSTIGRPYYYKVRAYKVVSGENIYGPWSETVKYTRQLPAPDTVTADLYGHDDISISWSKVSGASGYAVYVKKGSSGTYSLIGRTTALKTNKENLTDGARYYFKVVPYYKSGDNRYNSTNYKTANTYTLKKLDAPKISKYSSSQVTVKWNDIYGQTGYQISRSTSSTGTYIVSTWGTTSGISKIIKSGTSSKTYYYKVRAYKKTGDEKIYGPWSDTVKFKN